MTSIPKKIALGLILTAIPVFSALSIGWCSYRASHQSSITIGNWRTYKDSALGISFQYPADWKVTKEREEIILVTPPDTSSRSWDGEVGYYSYGIRIMPLDAPYPAFPVKITAQDIEEKFSRIEDSFFFRSETISMLNRAEISLLYDIAHNNRSLLALKPLKGEILQIELGQHFDGKPSLSDLVGFFGVVTSLRETSY